MKKPGLLAGLVGWRVMVSLTSFDRSRTWSVAGSRWAIGKMPVELVSALRSEYAPELGLGIIALSEKYDLHADLTAFVVRGYGYKRARLDGGREPVPVPRSARLATRSARR